jgi:WD40 repeat protein
LPTRALLRIGSDDLRTESFISAIAFSPDGCLVAAVDIHTPIPQVAIFNVRTGRQVKKLVSPGNQAGWVKSVAFSPDGRKLLWGERSGEVALWELPGDCLLFREKLHAGEVADVKFSFDGILMASASGDRIRLRRVAKPVEVVRDLTTRPGPLPGQLDPPKAAAPIMGQQGLECLAFTPDGARLMGELPPTLPFSSGASETASSCEKSLVPTVSQQGR